MCKFLVLLFITKLYACSNIFKYYCESEEDQLFTSEVKLTFIIKSALEETAKVNLVIKMI